MHNRALNKALACSFWLASLSLIPAAAQAVTLVATDVGFVTEMGGSAKGDATLAPPAKFNYSVGFEEHYATGALGPVFAPMFRKNYVVFDLSSLAATITAATLTLHAGVLESGDPSEFYMLKETPDQGAALSLAAALAGGSMTSEFDEVSDPLVMSAKTLYSKLTEGPADWGGLLITTAMDGSFIDIMLTPAAVSALNASLGGMVILGGLVPTAVPPPFPQQPFGFTGEFKPMLTVSLVPEPATWALWSVGALLLVGRWARASHRAA